METKIFNYLLSYGLLPSTKGFQFLFELFKMHYNGNNIFPLKNVGYILLEEKLHASPSNIEKNIQNTISKAWLNNNLDYVYQQFGATINANTGKPTSKQFIYHLIEQIDLENQLNLG